MSLLLNSDQHVNHNGEFRVKQLAIPGMTVTVNSGTLLHDGVLVNVDKQESNVLTTPTVGQWVVVISVDQRGNLVYTYSVQTTAAPAIPKLPDDCVSLAAIVLTATMTEITQGDIHDLRNVSQLPVNIQNCQYRCTVPSGLSEADQRQLKEFYDKYEELRLTVEQLKLNFEPKSSFTMISDSGLKYEVHLRDDGTLYTQRVGFDIQPVPVDDNKVMNYKFAVANSTFNLVSDVDDFTPFSIGISSLDAQNVDVDALVVISCSGARIFSENFKPQFRDNQFSINTKLTRSGFTERFALNFVKHGKYCLELSLYDGASQKLIDNASVELNVTLTNERGLIQDGQ